MEETDKNQDGYQRYLEERKLLVSAERESAQQFDKSILTLSAGALALSITFIDKVVPHPKESSIFFLVSAWALFCLSLLITLVSFLTSQAACRTQRDILDDDMSGKENGKVNKPALWTNRLNYLSIGSFIFGITALVIFCASNLL